MNLAGTVILAFFTIAIPSLYFFLFLSWSSGYGTSDFGLFCMIGLLCWLVISIVITYLLFVNTVLGLDRGEYEKAKRWTLIGMIFSIFLIFFSVGIITLIIFLISYVSFDDALRPKLYYPPPYYAYPPQYPYAYAPGQPGPVAQVKIPNCKYCLQPLRYIENYSRWYCYTCRKYL